MHPTKQLYLVCKEYISYLVHRDRYVFHFPFDSDKYCPKCLEETGWKQGFRKLTPVCKCGWKGDALNMLNDKERKKLKIIRERKLKLDKLKKV